MSTALKIVLFLVVLLGIGYLGWRYVGEAGLRSVSSEFVDDKGIGLKYGYFSSGGNKDQITRFIAKIENVFPEKNKYFIEVLYANNSGAKRKQKIEILDRNYDDKFYLEEQTVKTLFPLSSEYFHNELTSNNIQDRLGQYKGKSIKVILTKVIENSDKATDQNLLTRWQIYAKCNRQFADALPLGNKFNNCTPVIRQAYVIK